MRIIKISVPITLCIFLLFSKLSFSCQCPTLSPISKDLCKNYDIIFFGKVDSVKNCGTDGISTAYFTINELYKGAVEQHVKIDFDCASECMMSFSKGEEWIIYSEFQRFNLMTVNICEHSRKFFNTGEQDIYQISSGKTFEEEKQFLHSALGIQPFSNNNQLNKQQTEMHPQNEQPSAMNKILLLLVSFSVMGVILYFTKTKKKNDR